MTVRPHLSFDPERTPIHARLESFATHFFVSVQAPWTVGIGAGSDVGKVRSKNEDRYVVVRRSRGRQILSTNLEAPPALNPEEHTHVLVVADGVGGEAFGEVASQLALETALELAGQPELADELRRRYLARPHGLDHAEYQNPLTGAPLGARPLIWQSVGTRMPCRSSAVSIVSPGFAS